MIIVTLLVYHYCSQEKEAATEMKAKACELGKKHSRVGFTGGICRGGSTITISLVE